MLIQLDSENADRNLTSLVTVLTHTPDASNPTQCQGLVYLGDGTKNLNGAGGDFELVVTVGGQTIQPSSQVVTFSTAPRSAVWTGVFPVPAAAEVIMRVLSPNAGDTDVDVTAYLFDVSAADVQAINKVVEAATRQGQAANSICTFTVGADSTTTIIKTSAISPTVIDADQFKGRVVIFNRDTTTTGLRSQGGVIASVTTGGEITLNGPLTQAPASGDIGVVV